MNNTVKIKRYASPTIDIREIKRYFGTFQNDSISENIISECLNECKDVFCYNVCYTETNITITDNVIDFGLFSTKSNNLSEILKDCKKAVIFASTVGLGIDRLISKYSRVSPVKSLCFQSIGAERIEALCDLFADDLKSLYGKSCILKRRFSPGYGDLEINIQKDIFTVLECNKNIGLTLTSSLLMMPSKSVTAIIGIEEK